MEKDPFLAAGIDIPEELPYQEPPTKLPISRTASMASKASFKLGTPNMGSTSKIIETPKMTKKDKKGLLGIDLSNERIESLQNDATDLTEIPEVTIEANSPDGTVTYLNKCFDTTAETKDISQNGN